MSDVFISYASEDRARAKMLAQALEAAGFSVWWDRKILAGQTYAEVIERELETASSVVVLWSKYSVASEWVKNEAQVAVERGILVPALIDAVKLPLEFRRKQTADLIGWDGDLGHAGFDALHLGVSAYVPRNIATQPPSAPLNETKSGSVDVPRAIDTPAQAQPHALKRRERAFRWAGAAALSILVIVALWIWDAFYRSQIDYFANVTKRGGLAKGIGELSAEQVRHRNVTLEFSRQGRRGAIKEIRAVNNRGAYPPEFAYVPPFTLLELNPLVTEAAEVLNTCRVTFEYAKGLMVQQSAYDRSDRLLYSLHYVQRDIAEYKRGAFSQVVRESGITHLKIVRPETGREAGLDKDVLFLDSTGTPSPDRDGSYGSRRVFDKLGLPHESILLGADGQPTVNRIGIAKLVTEHDDLGNATRHVSLGSDGRPIVQSGGAEMKASYDQYHNITELAFFGADGQLVTSRQVGAAGRTFAYDGQGNLVENTFFGPDRQLVRGPLGFAKQKIVWDEKGGSIETYFGPDGKPALISGRAIKVKGSWDKRGHLVEAAFLDENDRPVRNAQGCAKQRMDRDTHGNVADAACLDEGSQPVRDTRGAARVKGQFDERGNRLAESYFGPSGTPESYEESYVTRRWKYDAQGKATETGYFDAADKLVRSRDGFAKITYAYDVRGNRREVAFFDERNQPTLRKGGYAKIVRTYDPLGNLLEESLLDTVGKAVRSEDGSAKQQFGYDARGYRVQTVYFDESDRPSANKVGCAKIRNQYNDKGQLTEWACFARDGSSIVARKYGYAKTRWMFDAGGRLSQVQFFDAHDHQARSVRGYAKITYSYDEFGREIKRSFLDVNGAAVLTRVTIDVVEADSKSQRVGLLVGDVIAAYDGQEVADDRRFNELELVTGERPRQLTIERAGKVVTLDVSAGRLTGLETVDEVPAAREQGEIRQGTTRLAPHPVSATR